MAFRVVDKSSFSFETDLPASSRHLHPSGIVHAFRPTTTSGGLVAREEHAFAWIANVVHIERALAHLERHGFLRDGIVFIPYSNRRNWQERYPHAAPAVECSEEGEVVAYLNYRPYPNGLGELDQDRGNEAMARAVARAAVADLGGDDPSEHEEEEEPEGGNKSTGKKPANNMVEDRSFLPDAERDELHIAIFKYFSWLHDKLAEIEKRAIANASQSAVADAVFGDVQLEEVDDRKRDAIAKLRDARGANAQELKRAMDSLESAFSVIPRVAWESQQQGNGEGGEGGAGGGQKGSPFLEEALGPALRQLVAVRKSAVRKSDGQRRWRRHRAVRKLKKERFNELHFDEMFERLLAYKEQVGDTRVKKNYEDAKLGLWVRSMREKRAVLRKKGIEFEEPQPGKPVTRRMLTAERIERLDAIGFEWVVGPKRVDWEDRFRELIEYYETNGSWPTVGHSSLGEWIHKQRVSYSSKDKGFMQTRAPRLDEIGFEWTPRGNTRMNWEEGFPMLIEFGKANGHFDVKRPTSNAVGRLEKLARNKKDDHRLYLWVESLHQMYRSYKLGRKSGSLTKERVVSLVKAGFVFRDA